LKIESDFLVIGSGIAGLFVALKSAAYGRVNIVTKKKEQDSNTNFAQGGIASVFSENDSYALHIQDTMTAGAGLCQLAAVETMVKEGPERVKELIKLGVEFTQNSLAQSSNAFDLGKEGGHSRNRILHAKDITGRVIEQALLKQIRQHPNIRMFEDHIAIDLITEHNLAEKKKEPLGAIRCWGAYVLDSHLKQIKTFFSHTTILSTGGSGRTYLHTTNPEIATGDGVAMAFRAGATLANLEFMQFHPTALYERHPQQGQAFLISEALRGFGGILKNFRGVPFMDQAHPLKSLAPRDIVARAIDREMKETGKPHVYLDVTALDKEEIKKRFPNIYERCLKDGLDITREMIPVVPAAHYMCGGVVTDSWGRTSIENVFACGEVACTGVHGANRLASNSLLEAVVFSHRIVEFVRQRYNFKQRSFPSILPWDDTDTFNTREWVVIAHDRIAIPHLLWDYVGIVRSDYRLKMALDRITVIHDAVEKFYKKTKITAELLELRNIALTAKLTARCALTRKESRGLHYNVDYPEPNDTDWKKDTLIRLDE